MNRSKANYQIIAKWIRVLYIILFVYAATSKLLNIYAFKIQLDKSPFISAYAHWMAWSLPFIEYVIVGFFLFSKYMLFAFYASFTLLSLFSIYIVSVLNFSDSIPCACGGVLSYLGWKSHVVFNIFFMVLALIGIFITRKHQSYPD
ncbi:MauE/DoxX family redox-associated membrane protein [Mariniflexile litorale]|uniref:MauE/DoxX family redox-associated membrane protein n=1 Tax=Mariniflexile litorale TaxID=3045158 RepID=A0AAU7EBG1_9FLAO